MNSRRKLFAISSLIAVIALASLVSANAVGSIGSTPSSSSQTTIQDAVSANQTNTIIHKTIKSIVGPQEWLLQADGKGTITGSFNVEKINVTRGSTVDVVLTLKYQPGVNSLPNVAITPHGDGGMILPPSVAASIEPLQTIRLMQQNKPIPGALFTKDLTSFEPSAISLKPDESKEIVVHITVPQNWPDEMVGKETPISPTFSFVDNGVGFFVDAVQVRIIG
ncbi:MAG: hypothetical protein HYY22_09405 [Thaumarchaeota archaeon]|nr:hypothetical protein [Nitrososphaerota archaeon]